MEKTIQEKTPEMIRQNASTSVGLLEAAGMGQKPGHGNCLVDMVREIVADLAALKRERDELRERYDRNHAEAMIAHRFIESLVGEHARGRDFSVKVPMAEEAISELRAQIAKDERAHLNTIDERDAAEDWFGKLAALFGVETEFSNVRGYADIYNDCAEQLSTLRTEAAKLGHEPGCDSRVCEKCLGNAYGEFGCELAETACADYKPKPCSCAQSRIQEGKQDA